MTVAVAVVGLSGTRYNNCARGGGGGQSGARARAATLRAFQPPARARPRCLVLASRSTVQYNTHARTLTHIHTQIYNIIMYAAPLARATSLSWAWHRQKWGCGSGGKGAAAARPPPPRAEGNVCFVRPPELCSAGPSPLTS